MERIWRYSLFGFLVALVAGGAFYLGYSIGASEGGSNTITTTTITKSQVFEAPVTVEARQDNFLFQVSLDKIVYRLGEPVNVRFNLTYLGESELNVSSPNINDPFRLGYNSINQGLTMRSGFQRYTISINHPVLGLAVIGGGRIDFYVNGDSGPGGSFQRFSLGSTYRIEGALFLYLEKDGGVLGEVLKINAPPITIFIVD
ncbi:MAG TPA: hypothetical protein VIH27_04930 [Nitrososphaerales archaeon]